MGRGGGTHQTGEGCSIHPSEPNIVRPTCGEDDSGLRPSEGRKIRLQTRIMCKVEFDWKIIERITELASELLHRDQVGKDGRTTYFRSEQRQGYSGDDGQADERSHIPKQGVHE